MDTPEQKQQPSGRHELRKKSAADKQKEKDSLVDLWMKDLSMSGETPEEQPQQKSK